MFSVRRYLPADIRALGQAFADEETSLFDVLGNLPMFPTASRAALRFKVVEHPDRYDVSVEAPGASKEDLKLRVKEDTLIVEYSPKESQGAASTAVRPEGRVVLNEHSSFKSRRALQFASELADTGHDASMENGVLLVKLLKKAPVPQSVSKELSIR